MPCLEKIVRPPAYAPPWRFVDAVKSFFTGLLLPVIRCHHSRPGLPINGRQRCLDCGATRSYIHNSDFEHGNAGVRVGAWRKAERLHQNAHRITSKHLLDAALRVSAPLPYVCDPLGYVVPAPMCRDCGNFLDPFGICPSAQTADIVLSAAPVYCGRRTAVRG